MNNHAPLVLCTGIVSATLLASGLAHASWGTWSLTDNVTLSEDHAGTIVTNGFRVDCAGHYIYNATDEKICNSGRSSCGINADYSSHSKVINCHIEGFDVGVNGMDGEALDLRNSYVQYNGVGVHLNSWGSSPHTAIEDNYISDNSEYGIAIFAATGQKINRNRIYYNGIGIDVWYNGPPGNHFEGNDIYANLAMGFQCDSSVDVDLYQGIAEGNGVGGAAFTHCDGFDVWANFLVNNDSYGLSVLLSNNGIVEGNYGMGNNWWYDAIEISCSNNTWLNNTWGNTDPWGLP